MKETTLTGRGWHAVCVLLLSLLLASSSFATTYYVSESGNDSASGLDSTNAWASIDNGDAKGLLSPGDTVIVLPGTYNLSSSASFTLSGTAIDPIVYMGVIGDTCTFDGGGGNFTLFNVAADYLVFLNLNLKNSTTNAIEIGGSNNLIYRCIISQIGGYGIYLPAGAANNLIYNNTLYSTSSIGVYPVSSVRTTRIINNIITGATNGIWAHVDNRAAHNDIWNCPSPYVGGIADSAGGISANPLFVDAASGNFSLQSGSLCIDAGMDLSYPFSGLAPDIGALEFSGNTYWVSPTGLDFNNGLDSTSAWASIDRGEQLSILVPGDIINIMPGKYDPVGVFQLHTAGSAGSPITYRKYGAGTVLIDAALSSAHVFEVIANHIIIEGLEIQNGSKDGIRVTSDSCVVRSCYIHDVGDMGILSQGVGSLFERNVISYTGRSGIEVTDEFNSSYHNTVVFPSERGIHHLAGVAEGRIFNNIVVGANEGIRAKETLVAGFNDLWLNASDYTNGVTDSAGGIFVDPLFKDTANGDFGLSLGSLCIDAGLDIGYSFFGTAPDMGAFEYIDAAELALTNLFVLPTAVDESRSFTTCTFTITNYGPVALSSQDIVVDYYLSANGTFGDADDVKIGDTWFNVTIGVGGSQFFDLSPTGLGFMVLTWPVDHPCGNYEVFASVSIASPPPDDPDPSNNYDNNDQTIDYTGCPSTDVDLAVNMTVDLDTTVVGDTLAYKVSVLNQGPADATGVTVSDLLPTGLSYAIDSTTQGTYSSVSGIWNIGGLANGSEASLYLYATVNAGTTGSTLFNSASVLSVDQTDTDPLNDLDSLGVFVLNRPPVWDAIPDTTVDENQILILGVSATDPDGTTPSLAAENLPQHSSFVDNGDGSGDFDFNPDFTQAGVYSVRFIASDGSLTDTELVAITVNNVNLPPAIDSIGPQTLDELDSLAFIVTASDPDSTIPSLSVEGLPANAVFVVLGNGIGVFNFVPDATQSGLYTVTFIASDGNLADTLQVEITVLDKNHTPILEPIGPRTVELGNTLDFSISANDPGGPAPTLSAENVPINASFVDAGNGTGDFTFTPELAQVGLHTVRFIASDGVFADSELVTITVVNSNSPPVLDPIGPQTVEEGQSLIVAISASDPDSSFPALTAENLPANALLVDDGDGTGNLTFNPDFTQVGFYTVRIIASDGLAADSELVDITVTAAPVARLEVQPDIAVVSADSTLQFTVTAYDAGDVEEDPGSIIWGVTNSIGSIDADGLFDATTVGVGRVFARFGLNLVDTTTSLEVIPGAVVALNVSPDTVTITAGSTGNFTAEGYDSDSNLVGDITTTATWSTTDPGGSVAQGFYTAGTVPSPPPYFVKAELGGASDSSYIEVVTDIVYDRIMVTPDTASMRVDEIVTFSAIGFDDFGKPTQLTAVNWEVLGAIGSIDVDGNFTATTKGFGKIKATTLDGLTSDSSDMIVVELPRITATPLGNQVSHPGQDNVPVLAFRIANPFDLSTGLTSVIVHNRSLAGAIASAGANDIDTLTLWRDVDANSVVNTVDQRIASAPVISTTTILNFSNAAITPFSQSDFIVSSRASLRAKDSDTLDFYLLPSLSLATVDDVTVAGSDTVNSLGYLMIDGMVAQQVTLTGFGSRTVSPSGSLVELLTIDIPRNGYQQDQLRQLSLINYGTAGEDDIDSLLLFADNGDLNWNGPAVDQQVGVLSFTGELWSASGLAAPLASLTNRFFVAVKLATFADDGVRLAYGLPEKGIEVSSKNDGPIDAALEPVDTVTVLSTQTASIQAIEIPARTLVSGAATGPITVFEVINGTPAATTIESLAIRSFMSDPRSATQLQLDSQVDSATLYQRFHDDYDHFDLPDVYLASAQISNGNIFFSGVDVPLDQNGGKVTLGVQLFLSATECRNGNQVNLGIENQAAIQFSDPLTLEGEFPVKNATDFTIDAFPASAIRINPVPAKTLYPGQMETLVLDFELPRNGYASDRLRSLRLSSLGTENSLNALVSVKLYADAGTPGFSGTDELVGSFARAGEFLQISNLNRLLSNTYTRFFVVVDVSNDQFDGGNFNLQITTGGVVYASGLTAPDDVPVGNTDYHLLLPTDRITVVSIPVEPKKIYPGSSGNILLSFALYNGYTDRDQRLESVRFSNISNSAAGSDFADEETGLLSLYLDQNSDGILAGDPLLATGSFAEGKLLTSGLNTTIPAQSLLYFLVSADVAEAAIDSDGLKISVESNSDFSFGETVSMNGDLPLTTTSFFPIDGSIAAQYNLLPLDPRTLVAGQDTVCLFGISAATNGILSDILNSVAVVNSGTADTSDITSLTLWHDSNNNTLRDVTDAQLGEFAFANGIWTISGLAQTISSSSRNLFVVGNISGNATSGRTFRGVLPLLGCDYQSGNDGPLDRSLQAEGIFTISDSPLHLQYSMAQKKYTLGQQINLNATVTNTSAAVLDEVYVEVMEIINPQTVTTTETLLGPLTLLAGQAEQVSFTFGTIDVGSVSWRLQAYSTASADSSILVETDSVTINLPSPPIRVEMINSIPTAVTLGQTHVFPFSIRYSQSETTPDAAPARLDSLTVNVTDVNGAALNADAAFSRLIISSGYEPLSVIESIPNNASVVFRFSRALILDPGANDLLSLRVDIASDASAEGFRLTITGPDAIRFVDFNSGDGIGIIAEGGFPLSTLSCQIEEPSQAIGVSSTPLLQSSVNYGQSNVDVLTLNLRHPGSTSGTRVQLTSLKLRVEDDLGFPVAVSDVLESIKLLQNELVVGEVSAFVGGSDYVEIKPYSPPVIDPGSSNEVLIRASILQSPLGSGFNVVIDDSTAFEFRDLSSGSFVAATADTTIISTGLLFPISSGITTFRCPALEPLACYLPHAQSAVIAGANAVDLLTFEISTPASGSCSPSALTQMRMSVFDRDGRALDPSRIFDRTGFRANDASVSYAPFVEFSGGDIVFRTDDPALVAGPGESYQITLVADIEANVPYDHFLLGVEADAFELFDVTDPNHALSIIGSAACETEFPLVSGEFDVLLPAGRPLVSRAEGIRITHNGETGVTALSAAISYTGANPLGNLSLSAIQGSLVRRTPQGFEATAVAELFSRISAKISGSELGGVVLLSGADFAITFDQSQTLSFGDLAQLELVVDLHDHASPGNYLIHFEDSTFLSISDPYSSTRVFPLLDGDQYPLRGAELSLVRQELKASFTNYPNPFNPVRSEITTFGFVLPEAAIVDLRVYTITGELVTTLIDQEYRSAGAYQIDNWNGVNERRLLVVPGTYFCRLSVSYDTGATETVTRKVAVVR